MGGTHGNYAFGARDVYIIADLPDDATATALSLAIGAAGALDVEITVLLAPEVVDEAIKKNVPYRAPRRAQIGYEEAQPGGQVAPPHCRLGPTPADAARRLPCPVRLPSWRVRRLQRALPLIH